MTKHTQSQHNTQHHTRDEGEAIVVQRGTNGCGAPINPIRGLLATFVDDGWLAPEALEAESLSEVAFEVSSPDETCVLDVHLGWDAHGGRVMVEIWHTHHDLDPLDDADDNADDADLADTTVIADYPTVAAVREVLYARLQAAFARTKQADSRGSSQGEAGHEGDKLGFEIVH